MFLARLNVIAVIPFALFFGVLSIGGDYAARKADLPNVFLLLVVGLDPAVHGRDPVPQRPASARRADAAGSTACRDRSQVAPNA